jgi:hypothetical protein
MTRLVVAIHVRAHGELGLVLLRVEQLTDLVGVAEGVRAPGDGPGDRAGFDPPAVHAYVHLRRGTHEVLAAAEIQQEAIGCGIALAQPAEELRGRSGTRLEERLARDDLEEVSAREGLARHADLLGILSGLVVRLPIDARSTVEGEGCARPGQTGGRGVPELEVVTDSARLLLAVVHEQKLVREVEDEVPLVLGSREVHAKRLELQREVVAEGTVETEVAVLGGREDVHESA